ncbi:MAG: response regulator transcription factor [Anaerolineales bacterium]|jgi:DNA-binding NarL/FixJ family response regulator|nr:response regulator transcription factor [Anaerolineales bacterium]
MTITKTLLADDHALIRAGLRNALASLPGLAIVGEVGNGPDMLKALETLQPDLLVMDVNMPEFEPVTVAQHIRAAYPQIKILVVSAYDDEAYVVGLLAAGVDGYHLKDQPLADLELAVQRILGGGRWISDPLVNRLVNQQARIVESPPALTRRQRELLYLLTQGYNNQKIAWEMDLSVKTVENHLTALYRAIQVESRLEANLYAGKHPETLLVPEKERLSQADASSESLNVLVLDDNPRYRAQLAKLLAKTWPQAAVHEADDCQQALRLVGLVHPFLAFIDVVLKEEDGIQCARRIKAACPATLMVLISAYPDREFRRIGLNAGAVAFLDKKDIDAATLRQVIEDALARYPSSPARDG